MIPDGDVMVMTYNLYLGADLTPVLLAETATGLHSALQATLQQVAETNFPARAQALAREIATVGPDIVGLQEVVEWQGQAAAGTLPFDSSRINFDCLPLLLDALSAQGLHYRPVVIAPGVGLAMPPTQELTAAFTNRNVILMRTEPSRVASSISSARTGAFATNVVIPSPQLGVVEIVRGWASAVIHLPKAQFTFVTVHLEDSDAGILEAQAEELVHTLRTVDGPLVLVGDFNADARSRPPSYTKLIAAGFHDSWDAAAHAPGATCCQDGGLRNAVSTLTRRIDWILMRGSVAVLDAFTVGTEEHSRTADGLWPSDHGGVGARLRIV